MIINTKDTSISRNTLTDSVRHFCLLYTTFFALCIIPELYKSYICYVPIDVFKLLQIASWVGLLLIPLYTLSNVYIYTVIVFGYLFFFTCLKIIHIYLYRSDFTETSFFLLFQTNIHEAFDFCKTFFSIQIAFIILLILTIFIVAPPCIHRFVQKIPRKHRLIPVFLSFLMFLPLVSGSLNDPLMLFGPATEIAGAYLKFVQENNLYIPAKEINNFVKNINVLSFNTDRPQVFVVILGESINRNHMKLYGYKRKTNPVLSQYEKNIVIFRDVISSSNTTIEALAPALCYKSADRNKIFSIIDIAKASGFETFWISNQSPYSLVVNKLNLLAKNADHVLYLNMNQEGESEHLVPSLDEKLILPFSNILKNDNKNKLIFVHLMGAHYSYESRYPPGFNVYKGDTSDPSISNHALDSRARKVVNTYDNAVIYNDFVVSTLLKIFSNEANGKNYLSAMLYFSDHGEEVYDQFDFSGRFPSKLSRNQIEIPFILWGSDTFKTLRKDTWLQLVENTDKPYMTDELFHSLIDLLGISTKVYDPQKSLFSHNIKYGVRYIDGKNYEQFRK